MFHAKLRVKSKNNEYKCVEQNVSSHSSSDFIYDLLEGAQLASSNPAIAHQ